MRPRWQRVGLLYLVILIGGIALIAFALQPSGPRPVEVQLSELIRESQDGQIESLVVDGEWITATTKDGRELESYKGETSIFEITGLVLDGVDYEIKPTGFNWGNILISFLPLLLFGGLIFFLFFRARGSNTQAMSFGRSRARLFPGDKPSVTFNDVAGVDEAKQELAEVVEFLKSREKFQDVGARIPRGILLVGPPGTGKTLLARAIAGEAGVPYFSISGSEFVEMFVGVGASRVRDLFDQAKRNTPCIIFIDEIDAVGRHRGAGLGGSHDEREQTLNQILTEMDGFDTNTSVIVLAATNRPDILDPALLRPGRFDRRVVLDLPDVDGRVAILKVHSKDKPLAKEVDLSVLAKETVGFSGADLANLVNEAAILTARRGEKSIHMPDFEESIDRVIAGPERKSRRISPKEKEITAYHEAGHALVAWILPNADPPHKISIVARGMALGYTKQLAEDRYLRTVSQFNDMIAVFLSGHTAEQLIFNEASTGAHDDIRQSTNLARRMVTDFGMSDKLGLRTFGDRQEMVFLGREISEQKDYSDRVALEIDREVDRIIKNAHDVATKILTENKGKLVHLAQTLIARETLDSEALEEVLKAPVPPETEPPVPTAPATVTLTTPVTEEKPRPKRKPRTKKAPVIGPVLTDPAPSD
ncbi:MAG TPA: ATP-dependent metallopeptidase FtsH/Yme1/Tma family protein [Dehalococcoidia bacterium]|nr:ATP-dependent metallopeptidase FtsH/Yme1/Tma family protein [Dehalococcoidia bacterium]